MPECQVPLGPLAFFPGQLVHTNDILVHLGDDWHVEYSAKQAAALLSRRIQGVARSLEYYMC